MHRQTNGHIRPKEVLRPTINVVLQSSCYFIFPPASSVLVCGLRNKISLKNYYSSLKLVRSKIISVLSCHNITELFKKKCKKKGK